jgi:hypothetical protein
LQRDWTYARSVSHLDTNREPTRGQGSLVAGIGYVLTWATWVAQYHVLPKLVVADDAAQTVQNILAHPRLFNGAIVLMMINFVGDVLATWGLYYLLKPTSVGLSLLAAWSRLVYTAVGIAAQFPLVTVRQLLLTPDYPKNLARLGQEQLRAQVMLALDGSQYQFGYSLLFFGLSLMVLGVLLYKAGFVRRVLGILIVLDGAGWALVRLGAYFFPGVDVSFLSVTFYGELVLMVWLLAWGSRLKDPVGP